MRVTAVIGRAEMEIGALLKVQPGAVLELDRKIGDPVDILVNDRLVARGEIVRVEVIVWVWLIVVVPPTPVISRATSTLPAVCAILWLVNVPSMSPRILAVP